MLGDYICFIFSHIIDELIRLSKTAELFILVIDLQYLLIELFYSNDVNLLDFEPLTFYDTLISVS